MMPTSRVKYSLFSRLQVHCSKSRASSQGSLLSTSGKNSTASPEPKNVGGDSSLTLLRAPNSHAQNPVRMTRESSYSPHSISCRISEGMEAYFASHSVNRGLDITSCCPIATTRIGLLFHPSLDKVIDEFLLLLFAEILGL